MGGLQAPLQGPSAFWLLGRLQHARPPAVPFCLALSGSSSVLICRARLNGCTVPDVQTSRKPLRKNIGHSSSVGSQVKQQELFLHVMPALDEAETTMRPICLWLRHGCLGWLVGGCVLIILSCQRLFLRRCIRHHRKHNNICPTPSQHILVVLSLGDKA